MTPEKVTGTRREASFQSANLALHPAVTPTATLGTSKVPEYALAVLEWYVFDGLKQTEIIPLYNNKDFGKGQIKSADAISNHVRRWGRVWYEEQDARRPWKLYSKKEQEILREEGFRPQDFPFVHPRDLLNQQVAQETAHGMTKPKTVYGNGVASSEPDVSLDTFAPGGYAESSYSASPYPTSSAYHTPKEYQEDVTAHPEKANQISLRTMDDLKAAYIEKCEEWVEENKVGIAAVSDLIEDELEAIRNEAMALNSQQWVQWIACEEQF